MTIDEEVGLQGIGLDDFPTLEGEPSYLEVGLWDREWRWKDVEAAGELNAGLRRFADRVEFPDPLTGVERTFGLSGAMNEVLCALAADSSAVERLTPALRERLVALGVLERRDHAVQLRRARDVVMDKARRSFARDSYVALPKLLAPPHLAWLRKRFRHLVRESLIALGDSQSDRRWIAHNEPAARLFHSSLAPVVGDVVARAVQPSYVYLASYEAGAELREHTDREQCEYSISMLVDYLPDQVDVTPWPLYLRVGARQVAVKQGIGDALLYMGRKLPHFRDPLPQGHSSTSLFFHFVDAGFKGSRE